MFKPGRAALAAAFTVSTFGAMAFAHSGATGIVGERMELMKDVAQQMKQIGAIIRGKRAFDAQIAISAADAVAGHAGDMPRLFPDGSSGTPSEALPAIWVDWEGFTGLASEMEEKASALSAAAVDAVGAGDIKPYFAELGQTCSACHEDFRQAD